MTEWPELLKFPLLYLHVLLLPTIVLTRRIHCSRIPSSHRTTDVELGNKPVSETYSSHQQRLRRVIEDNLFLRNILLMLSNHENLLVQGRSKLYYSDKDPYYALTGSDYYIYTLRRIFDLANFSSY